ncbi:16S rRNA (cytosine(1402)-N(4))-methyltransferase RsmH [uncultured Corynebacterium sp.]|uniref:16S rRNA (cytosine(1402)-N(4))-methyltransferase RsmH n=1 Tax=uncultured Corynebacterium sp. TaxID=159447 RepID=UPI0025F5F7AC|nr:16S rRNA (cytosine(1402)-N(4))-methyltransferase RsmH [uncultured Corynebacterium sp.]
MADRHTGTHGHVPVMLERMVELIAPTATASSESSASFIILDGTLGAGGHTEAFLERFPSAMVIGVDRDKKELSRTTERLSRFRDRFYPVHARFDNFDEALEDADHPVVDAFHAYGLSAGFFDLGVSSMQLDQADRGFTYRDDGPLDMRMDISTGKTAADVLNTYSHGELARILKTYGDERFAGPLARAIVREREREPWSTSQRLVDLIYTTIPASARRHGGHPAKRTFQALRIEVNAELDALRRVIPKVCSYLHLGGRAVFMSYQSLEDKIVKRALAELTESKTPPGLPIDLPNSAPDFHLVTRGSEKADEQETNRNPRAHSVRVRAVERTGYSRSSAPPGRPPVRATGSSTTHSAREESQHEAHRMGREQMVPSGQQSISHREDVEGEQ